MKTKFFILILAVILGTLVLSACAQPQASADCPEATEESQLLRDEERGFCLLYPAGFELSQSGAGILAPPEAEGHRERLFIDVEDAAGRTAEQAVEDLVAQFAGDIPGFQLESSSLTLDGEQALVLHNLPGQDVNRQIIMVHNDRLYKLVFVPSDEAEGEAYEQMQALYDKVVESFKFIPQ